VFIAERQQPWSRRTQRRPARYRVGGEGRISRRAWNARAIATYDLDTSPPEPAETIHTVRPETSTIRPKRPRPPTTRPFGAQPLIRGK
jgi:hypothetical protein